MDENLKRMWSEHLADSLSTVNYSYISKDWVYQGMQDTHIDLDKIQHMDISQEKEWIRSAIQELSGAYTDQWHKSTNEEEYGVFVDPENMIGEFTLHSEHHFDDEPDSMVKFGLNPHPFFNRGFDAYNIVLEAEVNEEGRVTGCKAMVWIYDIDLLSDFEDAGDYDVGTNPRLSFDHCLNDTIPPYSEHYWQNDAFHLAAEKDELWWHRVVLQSVMWHINREDPMTKPIMALLQTSTPNHIPTKEEFTNDLDKIKLVEGLE